MLPTKYPNGVVELREYDALNRMMLQKNLTAGSAWTSVDYDYDAVGSLREMTDKVIGIEGVPETAVYRWEYDDRYRLTAETCIAGGSPVFRTEYDWDAADNRTAKREYVGGSLSSTTTYTNNILNQMTGWSCGSTNALYRYDSNGSRTNAIVFTANYTNETEYGFDEDNRLVKAVAGIGEPGNTVTNEFGYDYRTRRVYRATSTETNLCVFDGGLSVQEYNVYGPSATLSADKLSVEYLRGPDLGGGIGGMVYSIRPDGVRCSHANHRGDVIARTGTIGQLTWYARYEAFGTRIHETGTNPDRQKANTKDEEADLGLLQEGMRLRHLRDGTWLTRDPIGYGDGPNVYCYVHCNPITHFDPFGLDVWLIQRGFKTKGKADMPLPAGTLLSHTYMAVTDSDGNVTDTYSWGNYEDKDGNGLWTHNDVGFDDVAAKRAFNLEKYYVPQLGKHWVKELGDSSYNQDLAQAYAELEHSAASEHKNGKWRNNCKSEQRRLWGKAKHIHKQRIRNEKRQQKEAQKAARREEKESARKEYKDDKGHAMNKQEGSRDNAKEEVKKEQSSEE